MLTANESETKTKQSTSTMELKLNALSLKDSESNNPKRAVQQQGEEEPLLKHNPHRFVLFPIQFHDIWQAYKNAEAKFWSAEEIELSDDLDAFEKLNRKEQSFVLQVVSILCIGAGVPWESLLSRFSDEIQIPEARCFLGFQLMQKNIHMELCTVILDMLAVTEDQRDDLMEVITQLPSFHKRMQWTLQNVVESKEPFAVRLAAFAVFLKVMQQSIVAIVLHIAGKQIAERPASVTTHYPLDGLVAAVVKMASDTNHYVDFLLVIQSHLNKKAPADAVLELVESAVSIELELVTDVFKLSGGAIDFQSNQIPKEDIQQWVKFVGDEFLRCFDIQPIFGVASDPLAWVSMLIERESRKHDQHQPQQAPVKSTQKPMNADQTFTINEDF